MSDQSENKMDNFVLTQCFDFTKTLILSKNTFKFHIMLSSGFDFSFEHTKDSDSSHPMIQEVVKKFPSTIRRNATRKKKFLEEKNKMYLIKEQGIKLDSFDCDKCDHQDNCKVILRKHMSQKYKKPVTCRASE